jgi:branched-chain amino acid transport system substrate-binding protein
MISRRKWKLMLTALMLICFFAVPVWAAETFKIALIEAVSGPFQRSGERYVKAIEFLADEINASGGINGRKVEIVVEDSLNKPDVSTRKARKQIMDGVKVIALGTGTHNGLALAELAEKEKVICISYGAEGVDITGKACNPYSFRVSPNTEQRSVAIASFLATKPYKRFAIICQDYVFGHDAADGFKRRLMKTIPDAKIVAEEYHPLAHKDFGPYVSKLLAGKPEMVFTANWVVDLINVMKQSREMGLKAPFMTYYLNDPTVVLPGLGDQAIGSWVCEGYFETIRNAANKDFLNRWSQNKKYYEFERWPGGSMGRAYNGMKHFMEAVKKAGSFDVEKIIKTWEGMKGEGLTGPMVMRGQDHQMSMNMFMAEIVPTTKEFYPLPYVGEPVTVSIDKATVPLNETGCNR